MYSDMSRRIIASLVSNMNSASARASSVLPTPVGPRKRKLPIGRSGSGRPARERRGASPPPPTAPSRPTQLSRARAADRIRHRPHGLVLADHVLVQALLEQDELLELALHQLRHRDAGPGGD